MKVKEAAAQKISVSKTLLIVLICVFAAFTVAVSATVGVISYGAGAGGTGEVSNYNVTLSSNEKTPLSASDASVADLVDAVADTVVEITTESVTTSGIFQQIQEGAGSGVVLSDEDGAAVIITNHHVIDGARKITVRTRSGDSYDASLIGSDAIADIALVRIAADGLKTASFIADSDTLRVGQTAVAIGNPLGALGGTVTSGIISATSRTINVESVNMTLLQTNAAINPGNSGGGLFDTSGNLIGIVNAKSSGTGIEGLGFAIPANDANKAAQELLEKGYISGRPALDAKLIYVDSRTSIAGTPLENVSMATPGLHVSVVDAAGKFTLGDLLYKLDGTEIYGWTVEKFNAYLYNTYKPGDEITLTVVPHDSNKAADGVMLTVTLTESVPD